MKVTLKKGERHIPLDGCDVVVFVAGVPVEVPEIERPRFAEDPAFEVSPAPAAAEVAAKPAKKGGDA
ncbi:MAG TPA: hypothetical protein VGM37_02535 [Armatimonadota bacterium]|jgi:hypothetical protein